MINGSFVNKDKIEDLRNIIREALNHHIDNDYVLLDVPNHRNIGDLLIWQGELEYLTELPYSLSYSSNVHTHKDEKIKDNNVILLHGGGNFGDVWRSNQEFRNRIIKKYWNNKIIIFPQTIHYQKEEHIKEDAELYNSHPNLIICARDQTSFEFAEKYFFNCTTYQLPDMAFFLDFTKFQKEIKTDKTLLLKRLDKELGSEELLEKTISDHNIKNLSIKDWPGFIKNGTFKRRMQHYLIKGEIILSRKLINMPVINSLVDDKHGLKGKNYKDKLINKGINFINQYDVIYSTRLHGFILSVLLNKKVFIFDNSYGKNKNFFNTWLKDFENVELIENKK